MDSPLRLSLSQSEEVRKVLKELLASWDPLKEPLACRSGFTSRSPPFHLLQEQSRLTFRLMHYRLLSLENYFWRHSTGIGQRISLDLSSSEGTPKRTPAPGHYYIMLQNDIYRPIQAEICSLWYNGTILLSVRLCHWVLGGSVRYKVPEGVGTQNPSLSRFRGLVHVEILATS